MAPATATGLRRAAAPASGALHDYALSCIVMRKMQTAAGRPDPATMTVTHVVPASEAARR
jgi:hypothetical protein